jgi:hypothetical protein
MAEKQRGLPARPNLDLLRKRAKRLLAAVRQGDESARRRVVKLVGNRERLMLGDVQLAMAREYGFSSWRALVACVAAVNSIAGALLGALRGSELATLQRLFDAHPQLVNLPVDLVAGTLPTYAGGARPLHVAVAAGQLETVRLLIARGADLDALNGGGRSALHDSLEHGRREITDALLSAGATVDVFSAAQLGDGKRLKLLLEQDPALVHDMSTELPLLGWLSYAGNVELLPVLVEHGAKLDAFAGLRPAASCNHWRFVEAVLDLGVNPDEPASEQRRTALHFAAQMSFSGDSSETVRVLLGRGADPRALDASGQTPLDLARHGALDPGWRDYHGVIALLEAALAQS